MTVREELQRISEANMDGTATDADRERLAALLAGNPSAGEVWADVEAARNALSQAGLEAPPVDLRESILQAVAATPRGAKPAPAWWRAVVQSLEMRPASRVTWGLAALVGVSVLAVALLTGRFDDGRDFGPSVVATLSPNGDSDATPPAGPGPRAEASAVLEGGTIPVRVTVHGAGGSDVSVTWDADAALVHGFRWARGSGDAPSLEPGRVLTHVAGDAVFEFTLVPTGPALPKLRLHLRSGDREQVLPLRIESH